MRLFRFGSLAFFVAVVAGCQPPERAVLIDVHTQADLEDLRITVISLDSAYRWEEPMRHVRRTAEDIDADPVRVAVILGGASYVMVHLDGTTPDGGHVVATRCYQVDGVIHDEVLLFGPLGELDIDGDGFVADPASICREPGPDGRLAQSCDADLYVCPAERASDCNETDASIHPGAAAVCLDGVDQDCDGADEPCGDQDGDGVDACPADPTGPCDCNDSIPSINPRAEDVCLDGIDQDCDGRDACCDADMDGSERCANGLPDCNDDDAAIPGTEVCDSVDNNCNGAVDELDECRGPDLDSDGVAACGREAPGDPCDCNDCDPSIHEGAEERCGPRVDPGTPGNGIDDDCDGMIDEGCRADDADGDGVEAARDCNDNDPLFFPPTGGRTPIEYCMDTVANDCIPTDAATSCDGDTDGDGYLEPAECEGNAAIHPGAAETCNGVDDDCDGLVDEGLSNGTTGCAAAVSLDFNGDVTNCGGCRVVCNGQTANQCVAGVCGCQWNAGGAECASSDTCCPGIGCADLQNDPANCGMCGNACGFGETCMAGRCVCGAGTPAALGEDACPEAGGGEINQCCPDGACHDTGTQTDNCGGCGIRCGTSELCSGGRCTCGASFTGGVGAGEVCTGASDTCCADGCTDTGTDARNCGRCGMACATGELCAGGVCTAVCGNGIVTPGEACDDGRTTACGACNATCTGPGTGSTCGDGVVCEDSESCDDGHATACGACNATCTGPGSGSTCGDGAVCPDTEACDDGRTTACGACNATCTGPGSGSTCGDGTVCPDTEACDDGRTTACGACNATCTALGTGSTCGDGSVCTDTEVCDDGNMTTETACPYGMMSCTRCNATCSMSLSLTGPYCGDGTVNGSEGCDDGGRTGGDGCSSTCAVELGWDCSSGTCVPRCGDGMTVGSEACDDGNTMTETVCPYGMPTCMRCNGTCTMALSLTGPYCGDSMVNGPETCDTGFTDACGTCNATCTGAGIPSVCGDGVVCAETEACDDYNNNNCGTCNNACTSTRTGGNCPAGTGCATGADCMSGTCTAHLCI